MAQLGERARRHHIVSRFYLERFADARGRVRQTWLPGDRSHLSNVSNVSVVHDYFSVEFDEAGVRVVTDFWEKAFAEIEGAAASAFRQVEDGEWPIAVSTREALAAWSALQWLRGDSKRRQHAEIQSAHYRLIAGVNGIARLRFEMERALHRQVGDAELEAEWMDLTHTDGPTVVTDPAEHIDTIRRTISLVHDRLMSGSLAFWRFDRKTLLTSDTPVVLLGTPPYPGSGLGLNHAEFVAVPLSRFTAMAFVRDGDHDSQSSGTTAISMAFNGAVSYEARLWCVTHPDDDLDAMGAVLNDPRPRELQPPDMGHFIERDRPLETTQSIEDVVPGGPNSIPLVYPGWPLPGRRFVNPFAPDDS